MGIQEERFPFLTWQLSSIGKPALLCAAALIVGWGAGCTASSEMGPSGSGGGRPGGGSGGASATGGGSGGASDGSGGSTAGSGGASGTGGSVGSSDGSGGAAPGDGGPGVTDGGPGNDAPATGDMDAGLQPLMECSKPSIDRIEYFGASGEGTTVPMNGTLLVKDGTRYVAKQQYLNNEWHVTEVLPGNSFNTQEDFSNSKGFWLTWSSTADLWIQMRPGFHYDGGAQWVTAVPSTSGQVKMQFFPFDPASWTTISLGKPSWTYAMARAAVRGLLFIGDKPNTIMISGLRIDGYTPMCM